MKISSRTVQPPPTLVSVDILAPAERAVFEAEASMIARELKNHLSASELYGIKLTPDYELPIRHLALRCAIVSEYDLDDPDHHITAMCERDPIHLALVSDHPCFPDNFSGTCLLRLKEIL